MSEKGRHKHTNGALLLILALCSFFFARFRLSFFGCWLSLQAFAHIHFCLKFSIFHKCAVLVHGEQTLQFFFPRCVCASACTTVTMCFYSCESCISTLRLWQQQQHFVVAAFPAHSSMSHLPGCAHK